MHIYNYILIISCLVVWTYAQVDLVNRIKGGEFAEEGDIPYIVSVRGHDRHVCGGSILNEYYILTAAHCVHGYENRPEIFSIQYGVVVISERYPNVLYVKNITKHENYELTDPNPNDIALLELETPILFSKDVEPVQLPTPFQPAPAHSDAILAGWGLNDTGGHLFTNLQKVTIKIFSDRFCNVSDESYDSDLHICAGIPEGGKGQCTGDSGGPLVVDGIQYGIVSWSKKPCASKGHPGYFTKVQEYRNWIRQKSGI